MVLNRNSCFVIFLLFSLTLWCKSTSAGSSFLSPSHKPQNKGKPPRVGRQVMEEPRHPAEDKYITVSAPIEIGLIIREEDFEQYAVTLQEIIERLLGDTEAAAEKPSPF